MLFWAHDKMRQSKATSQFYLNIDKNQATMPPTNTKILPLLGKMSDFFISYRFILILTVEKIY